MFKTKNIDIKNIFSIYSDAQFEQMAIQIFHYQYERNDIYRQFVDGIRVLPKDVKTIYHIPFFPVEFFKTRRVVSFKEQEQLIFTSSGTTKGTTSNHFVFDVSIYEKSFLKAFELFYGPAKEYCFLALLPSYMERQGSSLIYMTDYLIKQSNHSESAFYLNNYEELASILKVLENKKTKTILIGVSYALIDFVDQFPLQLKNTIVMETGGMKGRKKEMVRAELHQQLSDKLGVRSIHSEYGMTELLSQAYSKSDGKYNSPPWMKVLIRDTNDPFHHLTINKTGGINVIDLANIHSCSFIATQDLGKITTDGSFEVLGRFDNSDLRGCNLMIV